MKVGDADGTNRAECGQRGRSDWICGGGMGDAGLEGWSWE